MPLTISLTGSPSAKTCRNLVLSVEEGDNPVFGAEAKGKSNDALDTYCVNLNEKAKAGRIDPLIGRSEEVDRTIQVLCRRQKNNPLFVGDPGVGKTAIAEGLARKIVRGEVPEVLEDSTIFSLDMGSCWLAHAIAVISKNVKSRYD